MYRVQKHENVTMKTKKMLIAVSLMLVVLIVIYNISDFSVRNLFPKEQLPAQYLSYKIPEQSPASPKYQMSLFFKTNTLNNLEYQAPIYDSINHNVILCKYTEPNNSTGNSDRLNLTTFYKLNKEGNLIDSLSFGNEKPEIVNGYMLFANYYNSWPSTGSKKPRSYIPLNTNNDFTSQNLKEVFRSYYNTSIAVHYDENNQYYATDTVKKQAEHVIFIKDDKCYDLFGKNLFDYTFHPPKNESKNFEKLKNKANNDKPEVENPYLYLAYFQKKHFEKGSGPKWGSPNGNSTQSHWNGLGYVNLMIKKENIGIILEMTKNIDDPVPAYSQYRYNHKLYYFKHPELNFAIFAKDDYSVFLVKEKSKI